MMEIRLSSKEYESLMEQRYTDLEQLSQHFYQQDYVLNKLVLIPINIDNRKRYYSAPVLILKKRTSPDIDCLVEDAFGSINYDLGDYQLIFPAQEKLGGYLSLSEFKIKFI